MRFPTPGAPLALCGLVTVVAALPAGASGKGRGRTVECKAAPALNGFRHQPRPGPATDAKLLRQAVGGTVLQEFRRRPNPGKYTKGVKEFWLVSSTDEVGLVTCLMNPVPGQSGAPRSFCTTPDGWLFLLMGEGNTIFGNSPTLGRQDFTLEGDARAKDLVLDPEGRLHYFGDRTFGKVVLGAPAGPHPEDGVNVAMECRSLAGPDLAVAGADGDFWGFSGDRMFHIKPRTDSCGTDTSRHFAGATSMAFDPGTGYLFWVNPGKDRINLGKPGAAPLGLALEGKSCPRGIVLGPDKRMWVTLEGRDEIAVFDPATGTQQKPIRLPRAEGQGPLGPHGIAVGDDGNLWVTLRTAGKIARITPKGVVKIFDLPFGKNPTAIRKSHDGRMLFTLADTPCLCAITAVPRTIPDYLGLGAEAKDSVNADRKSAKPAPAGRKLSRAERHRLHDERIRRADARERARTSAATVSGPAEDGEAEQDEDEASYLPGGHVATEGKEESKEEPAGTPVERLARINVFLTPKSVQHVHKFHRYGADAGKSQFAVQHSTRPRLKELLARALEAAHRAGTLCRIKDGDDAHLTFCDLGEPVGWYNPGDGNLIPTSWIRVVTAKYRNVDENVDEHYLISMYPDLEPW